MWKLANTWQEPANLTGQQRGMPAPGVGRQFTGIASIAPALVPRDPVRPTKGARTWRFPWRGDRGFPEPEGNAQRRPRGSMPNVMPIWGLPIEVETPYYDRGADAFVQNYGRIPFNPIGAGIVALSRTQPSYGPAGEYHDSAIWWVSQSIPTSIGLDGLTDPEALEEQVGSLNVQAMVRTTG